MAYDPDLDLLYIGVGNGSPWNQAIRSPGGGDNLFLSSIVALRPDTGEYVWHYQETPGETWDFTATQHIVLADLSIGGTKRKVLMQAPKNGYFYVIDRTNGALISGDPYVKMNWSSGIDMKTGRPIENPQARYDLTGKPVLLAPAAPGGHDWQPMAFSPRTGLVYLPAHRLPTPYEPLREIKISKLALNLGVAPPPGDRMPAAMRKAALADMEGVLVAWDPVKRAEAWRVTMAAPWNGGLLATGGGLVFEGDATKTFAAYDARDGRKLWSFDAQTGIVAAPISYALDGEQYVAVMAGYGGAMAYAAGELARKAGDARGPNRLLVFKLGAKEALPTPARIARVLDPPADKQKPDLVKRGAPLYAEFCSRCHGAGAISSSGFPDLRYSAFLKSDSFFDVVLNGALAEQGMAAFGEEIDRQEAAAIRAFLITRAQADKANKKDPAP
jgi:alcohol dehydrogenase (cytochrome c)/quinohemoprotein ethanol dehydrogenase